MVLRPRSLLYLDDHSVKMETRFHKDRFDAAQCHCLNLVLKASQNSKAYPSLTGAQAPCVVETQLQDIKLTIPSAYALSYFIISHAATPCLLIRPMIFWPEVKDVKVSPAWRSHSKRATLPMDDKVRVKRLTSALAWSVQNSVSTFLDLKFSVQLPRHRLLSQSIR